MARPPVNAVFILWCAAIEAVCPLARPHDRGARPADPVPAVARFWARPTFARAGRGDYVEFLAPGIITMGILFTAVFSGIGVIWDRHFGFLKETLVAPVSRLEIVLGRTLGSATVALIQGSTVFLVCLAAGFRPAQPLLLPVALLFMVLIAIMCTAIGTAVGSVPQDMQGFQLIINFIVLPLFFFERAVPGAGPARGGAARRAAQPAQLWCRRTARRAQRRFRVRRRGRLRRPRRPRRGPARDRRLPVLKDRGVAVDQATIWPPHWVRR